MTDDPHGSCGIPRSCPVRTSPGLLLLGGEGFQRCLPTGSGVYPSALRGPRFLWKRNRDKVDNAPGETASVWDGRGEGWRASAARRAPAGGSL